MTKFELERARKQIINFTTKYAGKEIEVDKLNDKELYSFILTDTYLKIDALLGYDSDVSMTLTRASEKAEQHKRDNFVTYRADHKGVAKRFI